MEMGRRPTKAADNPFCKARIAAAQYNERLLSKEGASELLGVSVSTLSDYELGLTKSIPPDMVVKKLIQCPRAGEPLLHRDVPFGVRDAQGGAGRLGQDSHQGFGIFPEAGPDQGKAAGYHRGRGNFGR